MDNESMEEEMEISRNMTAIFYIEGIGIISVGAIGCLINLVSILPTYYKSVFWSFYMCLQSTEIHKQIEEAIDIFALRPAINSCFVAFVLPSSGQILAT